jgi:hypothetical protein
VINQKSAASDRNNPGVATCRDVGVTCFAGLSVLTPVLLYCACCGADAGPLIAAMALLVLLALSMVYLIDQIRRRFVGRLTPTTIWLTVVAPPVEESSSFSNRRGPHPSFARRSHGAETIVLACSIGGRTRRDTPPPWAWFAH